MSFAQAPQASLSSTFEKSIERVLRENWVRLHAEDRFRIWEIAPDQELTKGLDCNLKVTSFPCFAADLAKRFEEFDGLLHQEEIIPFLEAQGVLYPVHWRDAVDNGIASQADDDFAPRFDRLVSRSSQRCVG